jgi:hypothetical protein
MRGDLTLKERVEAFAKDLGGAEIKVNVGVYNKDMKCVYIQKSITLFDLFRFVNWKGYKSAVGQIMNKIELAVKAGKSVIDNLTLDRDFNMNIEVSMK